MKRDMLPLVAAAKILQGTGKGVMGLMMGASAAIPFRDIVNPNPVWAGSGAGSWTT